MFWRCKNMLWVLYHRAKFGVRISPSAGKAKRSVFCLSVCSSRFWTSDFVRSISPRRQWSTETILILFSFNGVNPYIATVTLNFTRPNITSLFKPSDNGWRRKCTSDSRAKERRRKRTTIIRWPPSDQTPGWPIRLPPPQHYRIPVQTHGCPCQCSTEEVMVICKMQKCKRDA